MKKRMFLILIILIGFYKIDAQSTILTSAITNFNNAKYEESRKQFATIGKNSVDYGEAKFYLGRINLYTKQYNEAVASFKEAVNANNKKAEYYFWLGNAYVEKAKNSNVFQQAFLASDIQKSWETGIKLDPTHQGLRWGLMNYYSQTPWVMGGNMSKAYEMADGIKIPDRFEAKGYVYERDNKKDLAEKSFKEGIKSSPKEMKFYYALAYFYDRNNEIDKSTNLFEQMIIINPEESNAYLELGKQYSKNNRKQDLGQKYLNRFLKMTNNSNKDMCMANYYVGNICVSKGDKITAKKYYDKALSFDPTFNDAKKALGKL